MLVFLSNEQFILYEMFREGPSDLCMYASMGVIRGLSRVMLLILVSYIGQNCFKGCLIKRESVKKYCNLTN